jgi:hypothetical protein
VANLSLVGGKNQLTWTISGLSSAFTSANYTSVGITANRFTVGGVSSLTGIVDAVSPGGYPSDTITCAPGTYTFWGFALVPAGTFWPCGSATVTVTSPITAWSWSDSNGSATAAQTATAYAAITNKGKTNDFSYIVWNDLVDKINEAVTAAGSMWTSTYASLDSTKMTPSDKTMNAVRFNSARLNVGAHYSTGLSEVSKGDKMLGSYFVTLASKLNEWIATL